MRKSVQIPHEELTAFRREHGLTIDGMASYFEVARPTMCGWLYRHNHQKMDPIFYQRIVQKIEEKHASVSAVKPPHADTDLSPIASAIKGNTDECWLHYAFEVYGSNMESEKLTIIDYIGIGQTTLSRWLNLMMPQGQNLLRLRCFLARRGYGVAELEALSDVVRTLSYLIADKKITITEVIRRTGFPKDGPLLQVLLGRENMSNERLSVCGDLIAEYVTGEKKASPSSDSVDIPKTEKNPISVEVDDKKKYSLGMRVNGRQKWEVENLAAFVRMMLPLAEAVLSDEYTEQDRDRLRTLANGDGVFRLSNALNGLCGPRARLHIMAKAGEE